MTEKPERKDMVMRILEIIQDQLTEMRSEMAEMRAQMATKADTEALRAQIARVDQRVTSFTLAHRLRSAEVEDRLDALEDRIEQLEGAPQR